MLLTLEIDASIQSLKVSFSVILATMTAAIAAIGAAISASCPDIIRPARTITGRNLTADLIKFILSFLLLPLLLKEQKNI